MATKKKTTASLGLPKVETVRAGLSDAKGKVQARATRTANNARSSIRKRPLTAVGAATGAAVMVGVVAGAVLTKKVTDRTAKKKEEKDVDDLEDM